MRSLLVTGASGFLGWHAAQQLASDWQIWGTYHRQAIALSTGTALPLDVTVEASVQAVWATARPDAVLHLAAVSKVNQCQQDPDGSYEINVAGAVRLAQHCATAAIPFIFASTDQVFDGQAAPYTELAEPHPINVYGQQKAIAEAQILAVYPAATICRLPLLFGPATPTATCFLQDFLRAIAAGQTLNLFTDEIRTPALTTDVIEGFRLVLAQGVTGIWHLGGPERLSRYEFGQRMAERFNLPPAAIRPCRQGDVTLAAPRPQDVSLDSHQAFALGYRPQGVELALQAIAPSQPGQP